MPLGHEIQILSREDATRKVFFASLFLFVSAEHRTCDAPNVWQKPIAKAVLKNLPDSVEGF
ncbi:hypothetical protein IMCC21224_113754 [Puniceibacterium sp. IMCC21224]|nr:hypothetical protein IMCC21224_113754 [Puniceibacterium sp. IMCC21224]